MSRLIILTLLKANRLPSSQIASQVDCCMMAVNGWVKRYQTEGIAGLKTRPGRGRKAILDDPADLLPVRTAVQNHRQKLSLAKTELEAQLGKKFSAQTLKRFLTAQRPAERGGLCPNADVYALRVACLAELEQLSEQGQINCFALLSRDNRCLAQTTAATITGSFVAEHLDQRILTSVPSV